MGLNLHMVTKCVFSEKGNRTSFNTLREIPGRKLMHFLLARRAGFLPKPFFNFQLIPNRTIGIKIINIKVVEKLGYKLDGEPDKKGCITVPKLPCGCKKICKYILLEY